MTDHEIKASMSVKAGAIAGGKSVPTPTQSFRALIVSQEGEIVRKMAQAIRDTPPCGDQAFGDAQKIFRALIAFNDATMAAQEAMLGAPRQTAVERMQAAGLKPDPAIVAGQAVGLGGAPKDLNEVNVAAAIAEHGLPKTVEPSPAVAAAIGDFETRRAELGVKQEAEIAAQRAELAKSDEFQAIEGESLEEATARHEKFAANLRAKQEAEIAAKVAEASPLDQVQTRKGKTSKIDGQGVGGKISKLDK